MSDFGLDLPLVHAGKVRRLYAWPDDRLLMVATDTISAYDFVLDTPIPDKGAVLTQLSLWWFEQLGVENHVVSTEVPDAVAGRALVVEKLAMVPVECVARGYLTGSGWAEYQASGTVCGVPLPAGLVDGSRLPEPIFTPAAKADLGEHDENITYEQVVAQHGEELAAALRSATLDLYRRAEEIARERGIILADTKFEFGRRPDGTLVLADEVLTPDSSRFWDADGWRPGEALPSFDKQFVRDWLTRDSGWDRSGDAAPPALPDDVIAATRARYVEAYERLTGAPFAPGAAGAGVDAAAAEKDDEPAPPRRALPANEWVELVASASGADLLVGGARSASDLAEPDAGPQRAAPAASDSMTGMARVVVDVMPKPEILDPQGKAVTGALGRLGFTGLTVRQGKRFEVEVDGEVTEDVLAQVRDAAEKLFANTVIESYDVRVEER
ncbi:phosphoribosylaminoimidazolesuccinocarboxamide synthase [Propioniciclava soli]|uniref:phosphoribosylaminoimidazolesuccinocarboxamide synthase n=1 Tax=Propioniciclava soli TaxID=2775081 RepID=UPI001E340BA2